MAFVIGMFLSFRISARTDRADVSIVTETAGAFNPHIQAKEATSSSPSKGWQRRGFLPNGYEKTIHARDLGF
jgi:hypothetical protein